MSRWRALFSTTPACVPVARGPGRVAIIHTKRCGLILVGSQGTIDSTETLLKVLGDSKGTAKSIPDEQAPVLTYTAVVPR